MNFLRRLLQDSKLCTIRNSGVGARHVTSKLCFTTHQVTEKELPQYVENVTSSFDLQSFTVRTEQCMMALYVYAQPKIHKVTSLDHRCK